MRAERRLQMRRHPVPRVRAVIILSSGRVFEVEAAHRVGHGSARKRKAGLGLRGAQNAKPRSVPEPRERGTSRLESSYHDSQVMGDPTQGCLSRIRVSTGSRAKGMGSQGEVSSDSAVDFLLCTAAWEECRKGRKWIPRLNPRFLVLFYPPLFFKSTLYSDADVIVDPLLGISRPINWRRTEGQRGPGEANSCENPQGITR